MSARNASMPAIEVRGLTKSYGRHRGLVDIDLEVAAGEVLGLVGANGAGKTTFMRTLLDFIRPTSGSVAVFGFDSAKRSVEVRRRTTYLPGDLVLPRHSAGHEVFRRFSFARPDVDQRPVRRLADRLDLDLSRKVGELSKGNKQKIGLLLAFAPPADLLVLDEPTSGLDPLLQRTFAEMVAEHAAKGVTVLLSSHVMSEIEHIATRVAFLRDGHVAVVDDMAALRLRSRRHGVIRPHHPADLRLLADALAATGGISAVRIERQGVTFACTGDMDDLVKAAAQFSISSFDVASAELEDEFFSTYDPTAAREPQT